MGDGPIRTVEDLLSLVPDGTEHTFTPTEISSGCEPEFYSAATQGEFLNFLPHWRNSPPLEGRPRPKIKRFGDEYIPLSRLEPPRITFKGSARDLADLVQIDSYFFLISPTLANWICLQDPDGAEIIETCIELVDGAKLPRCLLMPIRVIDAVDPARTAVTVNSVEIPLGSGRFRTQVWYNKGYVLCSERLGGIATFIEEHGGDWLWNTGLIEQIAHMGFQGLRFVDESKTKPDIRLQQRRSY